MTKIITAEQAVALIKDGMTVGIGGFATFGAADTVLRELGRSFEESGTPSGLHIIAPACPGDQQEDGWGLSALRADGLIASLITSHVGQVPALARAVADNRFPAFFLPLGVFGHIFRAMAGKKPPILTHVGKYTFCDPRVEGCKANEAAMSCGKEVVSLVDLQGKECLCYHHLPMDVCVLRGSYSDEDGNISMENEAIPGEQMEMAAAVHNNGGIVIVQVEKTVPKHSLPPRSVWISKHLVDYVVVAKPGEQPHTYAQPQFRPELVGKCRIAEDALAPMELNVRKAVARRGALELKAGALVNLGLGISDGISLIANEEGISSHITLTIETGIFGGIPLSGLSMGAGVNSDAVYRTADTFDLYDGGVLDMAFLSSAEIDPFGNVNVTKFGGRTAGPGGFINISQNAPKTCFMGTFTAGKQNISIENGQLRIHRDGEQIKFKRAVEQISFSGKYALEADQTVLYITERAVFILTQEGLELIEIAPGIDLEKDILNKMEFSPLISPKLKLMDFRIFRPEKMGIVL